MAVVQNRLNESKGQREAFMRRSAETEMNLDRKLHAAQLTIRLHTQRGPIDEYGSCVTPQFDLLNRPIWRPPQAINFAPPSPTQAPVKTNEEEVAQTEHKSSSVRPPSPRLLKPLMRVKDIERLTDLPDVISPIHIPSTTKRRQRSLSPLPTKRPRVETPDKNNTTPVRKTEPSTNKTRLDVVSQKTPSPVVQDNRTPDTNGHSTTNKPKINKNKETPSKKRDEVDKGEELRKAQRESDEFLKSARQLKRAADREQSQNAAMNLYISAGLLFMASARKLEVARISSKASDRYNDTEKYFTQLSQRSNSDPRLIAICHECITVVLLRKMMLSGAIEAVKEDLRTLSKPGGGSISVSTPGMHGPSPMATPSVFTPSDLSPARPPTLNMGGSTRPEFSRNIRDMIKFFEHMQPAEGQKSSRLFDIDQFMTNARRDLVALEEENT